MAISRGGGRRKVAKKLWQVGFSAARNVSIRTLFSFFNFGFFSKVSESQFRNCELPKFLGGQNARFDMMVGFVLESSSRFSAEQTES